MPTEILRPNGAGDETNFGFLQGAATNWEAVDDVTPDDGTTQVGKVGDAAGEAFDSYNLGATALTTETITQLNVKARFWGFGESGTSYRLGVRLSSTNEMQSSATLRNAESWIDIEFLNVPRPGGGAWAVSDLNALQVRVGANTGGTGGESLYSQVYVEVIYTVGPEITSSTPNSFADAEAGVVLGGTAFGAGPSLAKGDGSFGVYGTPVESVRTDTSDPYTFDFNPGANPLATVALLAVHGASSTDHIASVTYGGVTMRRVQRNVDTATEPGAAEIWVIDGVAPNLPGGNQTFNIDLASATTDDIHFVAIAWGCAAGTYVEVIDTDGVDNNVANPAVTLQYGGRNAMSIAALYGGGAAPSSFTPNANCETVHDHDLGAFYSEVIRQTTPGTADFEIGGTSATDDVAFAAAALGVFTNPSKVELGSSSDHGTATLVVQPVPGSWSATSISLGAIDSGALTPGTIFEFVTDELGQVSAGFSVTLEAGATLVELTGNKPASTGAITLIQSEQVTGNKPAATGSLGVSAQIGLAGNKPAATGVVTQLYLIQLTGNKPQSTGVVNFLLILAVQLTGNKPQSTGAITFFQMVQLTGNTPSASGTVSALQILIRQLTGNKPQSTGVVTQVYLIQVTGNKPASTGDVSFEISGGVELTGNKPQSTGAITSLITEFVQLTGNKPGPSGTVTPLQTILVQLTGNKPASSGTLSLSAFITLTGTKPQSAGTLQIETAGAVQVMGNKPASTGTITALFVAVVLSGDKPASTGLIMLLATIALTGSKPGSTGTATAADLFTSRIIYKIANYSPSIIKIGRAGG